MRPSGRVAAAIAVLSDFDARRVPLKTALADWARGARYAGAKDRAFIAGLCLDVLRQRRSLAAAMGSESARAATLAALRWRWGLSVAAIADLCGEEPHGPGVLSDAERAALGADAPTAGAARDYPDWLQASVHRAFGDAAADEMAAMGARADVDLRVNTLKADLAKALAALAGVGAVAAPLLATAARISAPEATDRAPAVTVLPAYNKGWVEVQDLGSQIAAAAAGSIKGAQVLDYCAGGGGKTLALAALMENKGQIHAYDADARRLAPLYERARRAGVRNLQVINPATDNAALDALKNRMDLVFVDAPCTGSGTWRRHPDAKWRLTADQLHRRIAEQDAALREASLFVKRGGRLLYVTCSFLVEENEDRIEAFLREQDGFTQERALALIEASGLLIAGAAATLEGCQTSSGALRLTPSRTRTDAFYIAALRRKA